MKNFKCLKLLEGKRRRSFFQLLWNCQFVEENESMLVISRLSKDNRIVNIEVHHRLKTMTLVKIKVLEVVASYKQDLLISKEKDSLDCYGLSFAYLNFSNTNRTQISY